MPVPHLRDMKTTRPTLEDVRAEYESLAEAFDTAPDTEARIDVVRRWDDLRNRLRTWSSLVSLRFNQDTRKEAHRKARDYRDELKPKLTDLDNAFKRRLLESPDRSKLEEEYGPQAFDLWACDEKAFGPEIEKEQVGISKLKARYTELTSDARFDFRGETLNLSQLVKYIKDDDRATREEATRLKWTWFDENRDELDRLFDELTSLRHRSAQKLGLDSFTDLGYLRMHRIDYEETDVERLRQEIIEDVVPLCEWIAEQQAEELGVDTLRIWDEPIYDAEGAPRPHGDHDWMVERAQAMFDDIGHGLGEFFALMRDRGLLDLQSREGKAGGGFCTGFPDYGVPFVFANFNGTSGDVRVFTHEMGHAFQNYSSRNQKLADYQWPTADGAEIHSMSLEFITWPWMENFFEEDADGFRRAHLLGALKFLPYGTAVDHFQHRVYQRPDASPAERFEMWREMEDLYLPWRNYGDLPHVSEGGFWQSQRHIYNAPFYYIDYVLAQVCAFQFWVRVEEDRAATLTDYVTLCKRGGEVPFQQLVREAGLQSPFEPGCLRSVVQKAKNWLG